MGSKSESAPLLSVDSFNDGLQAPSPTRLSSHNLEEFGTAFTNHASYISREVGMLWPALADELGDYQVQIAAPIMMEPPLPQRPQEPEDTEDADKAALGRLLALASAVGLPRQIERESAETVMCPPTPSFAAQGLEPLASVQGSEATLESDELDLRDGGSAGRSS